MTEKKVKKSDYEKALAAFTQAVRTFRRADFDKAKQQFEAFLEKYSEEKEIADRARMYINICADRKKKPVLQLKSFDDYYLHGMMMMNEGRYEESLEMLSKAAEMRPEAGKVHYLMADVYSRQGSVEKCLECLKKAVSLDKKFQVMAQNEADFEPLWEDKKFILITRMK
ncbi:MAG: tetratricopeptide repeat protein [Candidatus Aminicenantales bacterium]